MEPIFAKFKWFRTFFPIFCSIIGILLMKLMISTHPFLSATLHISVSESEVSMFEITFIYIYLMWSCLASHSSSVSSLSLFWHQAISDFIYAIVLSFSLKSALFLLPISFILLVCSINAVNCSVRSFIFLSLRLDSLSLRSRLEAVRV